ncbi:MAG: hypothetical protein ABW022_00830 [Actinoplanes sp.]
MSTPRLLGVAYLALVVLGLSSGLPWLFPVFCVAALLALGELWLRAATAEPVPPVARLGLATASGLVTLPFVAVVLHLARVPIAALPLVLGLAALTTVLGAAALLRERSGRPAPVSMGPVAMAGTLAAVAIPSVLVAVIGAAAVFAYLRLPHPPQPGFTSVALNGWAAGIDRPVAFPARGLSVPIRVSSAGEPAVTAPLRVRVGDRPVNARNLPIAADTTRSIQVYVPAPPDGCLHRIEISLGAASTVFYGRGPSAC